MRDTLLVSTASIVVLALCDTKVGISDGKSGGRNRPNSRRKAWNSLSCGYRWSLSCILAFMSPQSTKSLLVPYLCINSPIELNVSWYSMVEVEYPRVGR